MNRSLFARLFLSFLSLGLFCWGAVRQAERWVAITGESFTRALSFQAFTMSLWYGLTLWIVWRFFGDDDSA